MKFVRFQNVKMSITQNSFMQLCENQLGKLHFIMFYQKQSRFDFRIKWHSIEICKKSIVIMRRSA